MSIISIVIAGYLIRFKLVWKNSREFGIGIAQQGQKYIVVGRYRPAGNIKSVEYFENNVKPLKTAERFSEPEVMICYGPSDKGSEIGAYDSNFRSEPSLLALNHEMRIIDLK